MLGPEGVTIVESSGSYILVLQGVADVKGLPECLAQENEQIVDGRGEGLAECLAQENGQVVDGPSGSCRRLM